jgi:signal transduction histidine kinase
MPAVHRYPADHLRACVHDLRNLFAVVASAKSLLERPVDEQRGRLVLDALARVAVEGKIVTDALLTGGEDGACGSETSTELQSLISIFKAIEHANLRIDVSIPGDACWILMAPAEFHAVVLELVTNAARAGASRIQVRSARRGCRYWLIVADDGAGFDVGPQPSALSQPAGLHGTGMHRLQAAARRAHGVLKIRSKVGQGTMVALILPIIRIVSGQSSNELPPPVRSEAG